MASDDITAALVRHWQRFDWRVSPLAPGLRILQAQTRGGRTASGAGHSRASALARCLGETAEIAAIEAMAPAHSHGPAIRTDRCGLAAHPAPGHAARLALFEACERLTVLRWWAGDLAAAPVDPGWIGGTGLAHWIAQLRAGAALRRVTDFLWLARRRGPGVVVARSTSPQGLDPVIGYGCDGVPRAALRKALRELMLMEVALAERNARRCTGAGQGAAAAAGQGAAAAAGQGADARLAMLAAHLDRLAVTGPPTIPAPWPEPPATAPKTAATAPPDARADALRDRLVPGAALVAVTPPAPCMPVMLCQPDAASLPPPIPEIGPAPFL